MSADLYAAIVRYALAGTPLEQGDDILVTSSGAVIHHHTVQVSR